MNLTKFSPPSSHFRIIFEQEEEKRGIPLYQTWHIVNSITLYHITSHIVFCHIIWYHILSNHSSQCVVHKYPDCAHFLLVGRRSERLCRRLVTPPARRAWRSYKFASLDFSVFVFSVSEVGLPLMGDTAGTKLYEPI